EGGTCRGSGRVLPRLQALLRFSQGILQRTAHLVLILLVILTRRIREFHLLPPFKTPSRKRPRRQSTPPPGAESTVTVLSAVTSVLSARRPVMMLFSSKRTRICRPETRTSVLADN